MAIDTKAKRASCIGIAYLALQTGIVPNGGNLDVAERQHVLGLYASLGAFDDAAVRDVVAFEASICRTHNIDASICRVTAWDTEF